MSDKLIEAVARVIDPEAWDNDKWRPTYSQDRAQYKRQQDSLIKARAAILAVLEGIREPSKEAILAAENAMDDFEDESFGSDADGNRDYYTYKLPGWECGVFQAIIDTLKAELEKP